MQEEKSLHCLMRRDHFDFSTASMQDEEKEMKGVKGKNRRNSALGNTKMVSFNENPCLKTLFDNCALLFFSAV